VGRASLALACGTGEAARLQLGSRLEAAEDHLRDVVSDVVRADAELRERVQLVEPVRLVEEGLVRDARAEGDDVGARRVDEVADRVVGRVQHLLDVPQLKEEHQLDRDESIVVGPNLAHVVVGRGRDDTQLREAKRLRLVGCL